MTRITEEKLPSCAAPPPSLLGPASGLLQPVWCAPHWEESNLHLDIQHGLTSSPAPDFKLKKNPHFSQPLPPECLCSACPGPKQPHWWRMREKEHRSNPSQTSWTLCYNICWRQISSSRWWLRSWPKACMLWSKNNWHSRKSPALLPQSHSQTPAGRLHPT